MRAIRSGELPAGKGTIIWTARAGHFSVPVEAGWAQVLAVQASPIAAAQSSFLTVVGRSESDIVQ